MSGRLPADLSAVVQPNAWRVPLGHNVHFTGREDLLEELRARLTKPNDELGRVQVLHGPAGMGKTQLAVEYAHRFGASYGVIWWVNAESPLHIEIALTELAHTLGLTDRERHASVTLGGNGEASPAELRQILFRHLATRGDWLLIYDNAPDATAVRGMLPVNRTGHVIITSRNPNWNEVGRTLPVGVLDRQEAVSFLLRRTGRHELPTTADRLAKALGDLPLALDHAASLIEQTDISFDAYLRQFETQWAEMLRRGSAGRYTETGAGDYPTSVAMSWELSFAQVEGRNPAAADVLSLLGFFSPDGVPRSLLRDVAQYAPPGAAFTLGDTIAFNEAVVALTNFSLVDADDRTIRLHPLAAALVRARMSDEVRKTWAGVAARAMEATFRFDGGAGMGTSAWRDAAERLPHALTAARHADEAGVAAPQVRSLLNAAGEYLLAVSRFHEAKPLLERAMQIATSLWGEQSVRLSPIANNLGRALLRTAGPTVALPCFEMARQLDERVYGNFHPHVAEIVNNRGVCYYMLGNRDAAEADFHRALDIFERQFDGSHAKIPAIRNNLGVALARRQEFDAAREHLSMALEMAQTMMGHDHPTVAAVLRNLGDVYQRHNRAQDARACFERAADIDADVLGAAHPDVAADLTGLAMALESLGDYPRAKDLLLRAITIENARGNRDTERLIERYQLLARIHRNLQETDDARRCMAEIHRIQLEDHDATTIDVVSSRHAMRTT
jgi:tetratricopeptide (TPR) repeat protein